MRLAALALVLVPVQLLAAENSAVVKINQRSSNSQRSGTVLWRYKENGFILTCSHGLDEDEPVDVLLSRTKFVSGSIVSFDKDVDLALVKCKIETRSIKPLYLSDSLPSGGASLQIVGYPKNHFESHTTTYKGPVRDFRYGTDGEHKLQGALRYEAPGRGGLSGASVLYKGKIIGVHVAGGGSDGDGYAVPLETIHQFLADNGWR